MRALATVGLKAICGYKHALMTTYTLYIPFSVILRGSLKIPDMLPQTTLRMAKVHILSAIADRSTEQVAWVDVVTVLVKVPQSDSMLY